MKDVEKALAAKNLKPVYVGRFPLGVKDLTKELSEAKAAGADVIFSYTVGPENAVIARGRQALNWKVPQVGAWPLSFPSFIDGARDAAEGALMAQSFIAEPSNERRSSFLFHYVQKFNTKRIPVPMAAAQAYDATYLLAHAMFNVPNGKLEGPFIKASLEQLQAAVLRRGHDLRQVVLGERQGRDFAQHAGDGRGAQRADHLRVPGGREAQPVRAAQAVNGGRLQDVLGAGAPGPDRRRTPHGSPRWGSASRSSDGLYSGGWRCESVFLKAQQTLQVSLPIGKQKI